MPAPRRPNTAAATAAVVRRAQERKANELTAVGWLVVPPEHALAVARVLAATADSDVVVWCIDLKGGEQAVSWQKREEQ